tara:strand:- start:3414 stop:4439 length:1026 start_codon:yes stop_codon:yes gene_type:complete
MLPAILGMAAQALIPTTVMPAFLAGALGSGIGSLLQGGTTDDALQAGLLGGIGGAIGGQLGGAGSDAVKMAGMDSAVKGAVPPSVIGGGQGSGEFLRTGLNTTDSATNILSSGMEPSFLSKLGSPTTIGTGLGASFAPPPMMKKEEDDFVAPRGAPISGKINRPMDDYRPGKDDEFDYGFLPNFQEGGLVNLGDSMMPEGEMNDKELINAAVDAIKGDTENAEMILGQFLAKFGEDALRDLVDKVQSGEFDENTGEADGMVKGMGDGMDDMIPASMTDSDQDVLLSDGEFVVPADVVSGLGNGSSDAGADKLESMMDRVRELRTGGKTQPPDIPDEMMLPA